MEGIIKSISINPAVIDESKAAVCIIKVQFDAKQLAELYENNDIDVADVETFEGSVIEGAPEHLYDLSDAAAENMTMTQNIEWTISTYTGE